MKSTQNVPSLTQFLNPLTHSFGYNQMITSKNVQRLISLSSLETVYLQLKFARFCKLRNRESLRCARMEPKLLEDEHRYHYHLSIHSLAWNNKLSPLGLRALKLHEQQQQQQTDTLLLCRQTCRWSLPLAPTVQLTILRLKVIERESRLLYRAKAVEPFLNSRASQRAILPKLACQQICSMAHWLTEWLAGWLANDGPWARVSVWVYG